MSQSGTGGVNDNQEQTQAGQTMENQQTTCQNGRAEPPADNAKHDLSNGFENRTIEYDRFPQDKAEQKSTGGQTHEQKQQQSQQTGQYPAGRKQSMVGVPEDRHPPTGQLPPPQYNQEKPSIERTQHVSQTGTQTLPVQAQPQFMPDYDQAQYTQLRSQFEVRPQIYPQQAQYAERAGYVTRDVTYRDPPLYQGGATNPVFTGQGQYVTVQHGSQISSQSASPQPPFYSGVVVPQPSSYQFSTQPQYSYSQYPQTVMNVIPYAAHAGMYPGQQFGQQSPNPQRFSQELGQYQTQPIIQPIAQNVAHGIAIATTDRPNRGPKPMVPPRGNSKITHDIGHRKSASVDVAGMQKPKYDHGQNPQQEQIHRSDGAIIVQAAPMIQDGQDRRYVTTLSKTPRTRQDGLYVDANGDPPGGDKMCEAAAADCSLYVGRSEHRKSISVDVTSSFQRRNDTITFTFPGDTGQEILLPGRKTGTIVDPKRIEANQVYPPDQRRLDTSLRVSPMAFDARQENRKSMGADRKFEWGNVSPNQRVAIPQENRRSDYFDEHRRSPMTIEGKRIEDVRRSPMPFMPIREASADRASQKSPSFVNQNFEKTRQELAIWAEQRQRQEHEKNIIQNQLISISPRSRNQSEERRDPRPLHPIEDRKETRMTQSAFQPLPNISQSTIMEQRRHLRHVSADLTKHMELSRKEFDDQPISGSVANLGPAVSSVSSQRASPNICHQYPALSEAKLDTKTVLTVVTDFGEPTLSKPIDQVDHIIHSHRKSYNTSSNLLTHSKSQTDNLQTPLDAQNEKPESLQAQQQQLQNQHLDLISEKLSQFERQQSDLQAKLHCLQNQNQILDKVAQFQHQQSDLQARLQSLQAQNQLCDKLQRSTDFQQYPIGNEIHSIPSTNHQEQSDKTGSTQSQHQSHSHHQTLLTASYSQNSNHQSCQSSVREKLSPRLQHDTGDPNSIQIPNMSQMPLPCLPQFERADTSRTSFSQFHRLQCQIDGHEGAAAPSTAAACVSFTGTLKKVPPEKPPRTSLIVQSPESESNRSQPAIGLKEMPKVRKWPKEAVRELINLFKENEYLWKTENVKQSQKSKINKSWSTIAARMSIILNKPVTELDCQNKVINLKKYFWRENKRLRNEGKKTGTSKWCFYDSFSFLTDKAITKLGDYPIDALSEPNITGDMTDNILFSTTRRTSTRIEYLKNLPKETEVNATDDSTSSAMPSLERVAKRKATQTTNTPVRKRRIPDVSQAPVSLKNIELESTDEQTPTNSKSAEVNTMEDSRIDITDVQPNQKTIQANREAKFMNAHFIRRSADRGHTLMHSSYAVVDPFNSPIQDECQNFCLYVMHKMRTYSTYTRCAVQHAISDILFNADVGLYNCAASSSTLNVSTEPRHSNLYPHVEITSPISVCKTEDISDLDDEDMLSTCLD